MEARVGRQIKVGGIAYAPTNEQGVVFLFGRLASRLGFCVEQVQTFFPDCTARRRGKTYRIEFEYRASSYKHAADGADIVVCWENDWELRPRKYKHLEVIDLKKYVGALPRVIVVGCDEQKRGRKLDSNRIDWDVTKDAQVGDLIVMYRQNHPHSEIRDLWKVVGPFFETKRWGREAFMKCVVRLSKPVTFVELKRDPTIRELGVVKRRFQGMTDITAYWPLLCEKIISLNPKAKTALAPYRND